MQERHEKWVQSLVRKIPWSEKWQPTPVFLPGESHGQRSLVDCNTWGPKEWDMTEWLSTKHKQLCTTSQNTWKSAVYNLGDWSSYLSLSMFPPLWDEHNSHSILIPALGRCNSHPVHPEIYLTAQKSAWPWESAKQSPLHILQTVCSYRWSTGLWSCPEPLHRAALSDKASSAIGSWGSGRQCLGPLIRWNLECIFLLKTAKRSRAKSNKQTKVMLLLQ